MHKRRHPRFLAAIPLAPFLAGIAALVMLLLAFITVQAVGHALTRQAELDIGRDLAELAFQTTDKLDRGMVERYREVKLMAERPDIVDPTVPAGARRAVLESAQATHPYYAWIGLTDRQGRVLVATGKLLEGKDVSSRPWFFDGLRGVHLHDVHEAVLLAKLLPDPEGEPKRFFDVAFPYRAPDGSVAGVLGTHLSWQWARDVERSVLRPLAERKAVDTLILSRDGTVLLGPKEYANKRLALESVRRAQRGDNAALTEPWPDGQRYLVGFSQGRDDPSYPGLGWTVIVRQPVGEAFAPVEALRRQILWFGLGAAAAVSLLVWGAARYIIRPLATITAHADALRQGRAHEIPPVHSRLREVRILHRALNSLVSKLLANQGELRELNATLESRVADRTAELHRAVEETRRGERRVKGIIDTALDAFIGVDAQGRITDWNPQAERMFGWSHAEAMGRTVTETIIPERYRQAHESGMHRFSIMGSSGVVGKRLDLVAVRRSGEEFPVEMTIGLINAGDSHFFGSFIQDISDRKRIEDELQSSERRLRTITDNVPVLIGYVDSAERYQFANAVYEAWFGLPPGDVVGRTVPEVLGKDLYAAHRGDLDVRSGATARFEMTLATQDGQRIVEITRIPDVEDGVLRGVYVLGTDVSAARHRTEELNRLARNDALTGLPNRRAYYELLEAALQRAQRTGQAVALMYLDVDRFKEVNDTLGHAAGDAVLREFARRVRKAVRATDIVCRLAGDEFTVILEGLQAPTEPAFVAKKILYAFDRPFILDAGERKISTSIGVAYATRFPVDPAELGATADEALYDAKNHGRGRFAMIARDR